MDEFTLGKLGEVDTACQTAAGGSLWRTVIL